MVTETNDVSAETVDDPIDFGFELDRPITGEEAFAPGRRDALERQIREAQEQEQRGDPEPQPINEAEPPKPDENLAPSPSEPEEDPQARNWKAAREALAEQKQLAESYKQQAEQLRAEKLAFEAAQRQQLQQQPAQQQQPAPSFDEDPQSWFEAKLREQQMQQANAMANMSEQMVRSTLGDEEVNRRYGQYQQMAQRDPSLQQRIATSSHPWLTMCELVKQSEDLQRLSEIGDVDQLREQIRKEELEKLQNELGGSTGTQQASKEPIPSSLANVPQVRGPSLLDGADASLDEVLWGDRGGKAVF